MIHFMKFGMTPCLKPGLPKDWEEGEKWSPQWETVTCPECLAGRDEVQTFKVSEDGKSITCLRCNQTSHHPKDVENRYCGSCKLFHDDIWPPARAAWINHKDRDVFRSVCVSCGEKVDALSTVNEGDNPFPQEGDVTICFYCGAVNIISGRSLRKPTATESIALSQDEQLQKTVKEIQRMQMIKNTTAVYSGVDDAYKKLGDLTFPAMAAWASFHGAKFISFDQPPPGLNPWWFGIGWGLELLKAGFKRIIQLDADQFITNIKPWFDDLPYSGFHIGRDWGNDAVEPWHVSTCGFIAHQDCIPLFKEVLAMEPEWRDKPFQEQGPLRERLRQLMESNNAGLIHVHPRKRFNCVPEEACPGQVPEPWQPGDFAAHLTMFTVDQRCELIKKFAPHTVESIKQCITDDTFWTKSGDQ